MDAISQTPFSSVFCLNENVWIPFKISPKFVRKGSVDNKYATIGSDNGLASIRRQAIVWVNDG